MENATEMAKATETPSSSSPPPPTTSFLSSPFYPALSDGQISQQAAGGSATGFSSIFPAVLSGVFAVLVFGLVVQIARGRLARDLAQREADDRVAAARARRVEMMLREREEEGQGRNAAAGVEMAAQQQPPPTLVVSPGGGVWVAKAEKQFDDCFLTDDDDDDVDQNKKKQNAPTVASDTCCDKGKPETTGSDGASR